MFFENDRFSVQLFAVDRFECGSRHPRVKARGFGALALRLSGNADIGFSDGTRIRSRAGDVIYLPQGLAYDASYTDVSVLAFHFRESAPAAAAENFTPASSEIAELFAQAYTDWQIGTPSSRMAAISRFYKILSLLGEEAHPRARTPDGTDLAAKILSEEYCDPELTLPGICERAGLSPSTFRRNFCARYGKPPIKYLNELRLREAQKRLTETSAPISEVARACGFYDVKYFSRVVRAYFGCPPSALRSL